MFEKGVVCDLPARHGVHQCHVYSLLDVRQLGGGDATTGFEFLLRKPWAPGVALGWRGRDHEGPVDGRLLVAVGTGIHTYIVGHHLKPV